MIYGYLRETKELAEKAGIDPESKLPRTGLEEYLKVIFPEVNDWVHDKCVPELLKLNHKVRPDYRSESLKLIVEFDGLPHYQKPDIILKDIENIKLYESIGYKVVRIPYFIQLTNSAVEKLFNRKINIPLFNGDYTSLSPSCRNTPAFLCPLGIERMKKDYKNFKDQYEIEIRNLAKFNEELTGLKYLKNSQ